jgi:hypothetical protein
VGAADEPIGEPSHVSPIESELDVTAVKLYFGLTVPGPQIPGETAT